MRKAVCLNTEAHRFPAPRCVIRVHTGRHMDLEIEEEGLHLYSRIGRTLRRPAAHFAQKAHVLNRTFTLELAKQYMRLPVPWSLTSHT